MTNKRKGLVTLMAAVLLVAMSVMGTVAYLTSQDVVTNTFTVGNVVITLDELDVDNSTPGDNDRDKANVYKLMPGHSYVKDPTIHVKGAETCYLFVKVVNGITDVLDQANTIEAQMDVYGWEKLTADGNIYYYANPTTGEKAPVSPDTDVHVFDTFKVKDSAVFADLDAVDENNITVTAYAVQTDGFENKTAAEIWTTVAFE